MGKTILPIPCDHLITRLWHSSHWEVISMSFSFDIGQTCDRSNAVTSKAVTSAFILEVFSQNVSGLVTLRPPCQEQLESGQAGEHREWSCDYMKRATYPASPELFRSPTVPTLASWLQSYKRSQATSVQPTPTQIPEPQKEWGIVKNCCCFKSLNFKVIRYAVTDTWNVWVWNPAPYRVLSLDWPPFYSYLLKTLPL